MKQSISPATAAIIAIVFVAVIALVGYKFLGGRGKGAASSAQQTTMKNSMQSYGQNQRSEADKHRGQMGMPNMGGGGNPNMPGR